MHINVKKGKGMKLSSKLWLERHINDPFVKQAKFLGYRSRASFKLIEINEKYKILKSGKFLLDLGSAPGGWSQIAVDIVGHGNVIAVDLLEMNPIEGVVFLRKDFLESDILDEIRKIKDESRQKFDIIISDMAQNSSGDKKTDNIRISLLIKTIISYVDDILNPNGVLVCKIFQGGVNQEISRYFKENFTSVSNFKPKSSRAESSEMYMVAMGFRSRNTVSDKP